MPQVHISTEVNECSNHWHAGRVVSTCITRSAGNEQSSVLSKEGFTTPDYRPGSIIRGIQLHAGWECYILGQGLSMQSW